VLDLNQIREYKIDPESTELKRLENSPLFDRISCLFDMKRILEYETNPGSKKANRKIT
jgi:hypothetical protein